jgi:hypothetical protein
LGRKPGRHQGEHEHHQERAGHASI